MERMNVLTNKLIILLCMSFFICNSQTKKDDAYFVLNTNKKIYILKSSDKYINENTNLERINNFYIYDKKLYEERKNKIDQDKKEGNYFPSLYSNVLPKTMLFNVINDEREIIKQSDILLKNIVDFKWIQDNSWKENNPNILFRNLFFLIKIDENRFMKYKVEKTVFIR